MMTELSLLAIGIVTISAIMFAVGVVRVRRRRGDGWRAQEAAAAERRDMRARAKRREHRWGPRQSTMPTVPATGVRTRNELVKVIDDLVSIRPSNWDDDRDPAQRDAWRAADAMLNRFGAR